MKIINPDNLPNQFILNEIADVEREKHKRVTRAEFYRIEGDEENAREVFHFATVPFDRLRRITGYLVGTLDRWNDGKRAEEADRVKHGV